MLRILGLSAVLLLTQTSLVMAQSYTITVQGQLSGGNFVNAVCTTGPNGQFTGTGVLYGTNPSTGTTYQYPFTVTKGSTATGKLVLTGKMTAGPEVTLTTTVPNGPQTFKYVVNGKAYTLTGQGTVTVK